MNIRKVISGVISYILALILAVILALFLSANVGWFMLIALILALVLSVFFALLTRMFVTVQCHMENSLLSKGDTYTMTVTVRNKSIFPSTPIELIILNGDGVKSKDKSIIVSVLPRTKKTFKVDFKANISGPSIVGIQQIITTDYLGIIGFKAKNIDYSKLQAKVSVIPDVAEISPKDDRILKVMQASMHADDSEDTVETTVNNFGGFPGYDNREYVPGDPLKRINWKQSAKRDRLLVRLDDEMAAQSVSIVLDSVYKKWLLKPAHISSLSQYEFCQNEDILPKVAEDAVENVLGIAKTLISSNYTVNMYIARNGEFERYQLEDEKDVEAVRISMADYSFADDENVQRFPDSENLQNNKVFIFSTPNPYEDAYALVESHADVINTAIFSVIEEAKNNNEEKLSMYFGNSKTKNKRKFFNNLKETIGQLLIPFLLALVLSVTTFSAFRISPLSHWTVLQAIMCFLLFLVCIYVNKHRITGTLILTVLLFGILSTTMRLVFSQGYGVPYMQWFMSGGDVVDTTDQYLMTLILIFTTFFSLLIFYYTQARYRTSAVMMLSLIPFVVYAKIVRDVEIGYVMAIIVLNVGAFLVNVRKNKDKGKRIVGYNVGLVSIGLYAVFFILIALAVPKEKETRLYYLFEEAFLGGNTSTVLPVQYTGNSEYSGNADNYNQLNNRKLYTITVTELSEPLYLKRQVYDNYDYELNRWYGDKVYSEYKKEEELGLDRENLNIRQLVRAMNEVEELNPGFLEKYGMKDVAEYVFIDEEQTLTIEARNFAADFYIVPTRVTGINADIGQVSEKYVNLNGAWSTGIERHPRNIIYEVYFYEQYNNLDKWLELGGSNCDLDESINMYNEMKTILMEAKKENMVEVVDAYYQHALLSQEYNKACDVEKIPENVKKLAIELTKDCKYDWEKADVLAEYFAGSEFLYDLSYDAPDDSVEYFLFEGKTGTCSDFATAYVLMARSIGLTVRYVEGFVADEEVSFEYDVEYVVRTRSAHAYPEVYIPNYGFVVFEPTIAAIAETEEMPQGGVSGFVLTLGYRILLIFAAVSLIILMILLTVKVLAPLADEKNFEVKVKRATPKKAVVMIYQRVIEKHMGKYIKDGASYTPIEYSMKFEKMMDYDIVFLVELIEKSAYEGKPLDEATKHKAIELYGSVKKLLKEYKKR